MPPFVLTVLKVVLLLFLYFFIYRAVRTIALDLSGRQPGAPRRPKAQGRPEPRPKPAKRGGAAPGKIMVITEGSTKPKALRLAGAIAIGRAASAQIQLNDTYVSQEHARISQRNGTWVVEDLGSTNGTYLNQRKVTVPTEIAVGDRIKIGKTVIEVRK